MLLPGFVAGIFLRRFIVFCRFRMRYDGSRRIRNEHSQQGAGFEPDEVPDPTQDEYIRGLLLMRVYMNLCEFADGGRCLVLERERNSPLPIMED